MSLAQVGLQCAVTTVLEVVEALQGLKDRLLDHVARIGDVSGPARQALPAPTGGSGRGSMEAGILDLAFDPRRTPGSRALTTGPVTFCPTAGAARQLESMATRGV
jgi:hypothetical protein